MRKGFIAANWKMNGDLALASDFTRQLNALDSVAEVVFAPSAIHLHSVQQEKQSFALAAQTGCAHDNGAYTGEMSMFMLKQLGCDYVIVGHSERRSIFNENDAEIYAKTEKALALDLVPIFCIGESDEQNKAGQTESVLASQLARLIERTPSEQLKKVVIAYEPVWAIGTGRTPAITEIEGIHQKIRSMLQQKGDTIAAAVRIVYGGSVKPDNAQAIFDCANVDGGLVGGASLAFDSFEKIIRAYQ